jgi:hypothetical protein
VCANHSRAYSTRGLASLARRSLLLARGASRGGAAAHDVPCNNKLGSKAGDLRWSSHSDGGPGGMDGPRAPLDRGAAVLRLEGSHPGRDTRRRTPTSPVPHREGTKEGGKRKMAAVVLTLGRRCSRGRLEGRRWRGEGVLGDVDDHGGVVVPSPGPAPSPSQTTFSPLLVTAVADSGLGASAALRWAALLLGLTQRRCPLLPPFHGVHIGEEERENPNGGWWLGRSGRSLPLPLKPGAANIGAKAPICPGLDQPGGRGGTCSLCASSDAGARDAGAKGETPPRGRVRFACVRAPAPRRAGQPGGESVPCRARGCCAGHLVRRGSEAREERLRMGMS